MPLRRPAVVLLSGGLDSTTVLALAQRAGFDAYAITFRYSQRHAFEPTAAERVAYALHASGHAVDKKIVGPAYQDVAAKYRGDKDALTKLSQKVKAGGSGVWGAVPMPPNAGIKEADIKELVTWILTLKK